MRGWKRRNGERHADAASLAVSRVLAVYGRTCAIGRRRGESRPRRGPPGWPGWRRRPLRRGRWPTVSGSPGRSRGPANEGTRLTQALKKVRSMSRRFSWPTPVTLSPDVCGWCRPSTARSRRADEIHRLPVASACPDCGGTIVRRFDSRSACCFAVSAATLASLVVESHRLRRSSTSWEPSSACRSRRAASAVCCSEPPETSRRSTGTRGWGSVASFGRRLSASRRGGGGGGGGGKSRYIAAT